MCFNTYPRKIYGFDLCMFIFNLPVKYFILPVNKIFTVKYFKTIVIKLLTEFRKRIDEHNWNLN